MVLMKYFKAHFNLTSVNNLFNELMDTPDFISNLQNIEDDNLNKEPPTIEELESELTH